MAKAYRQFFKCFRRTSLPQCLRRLLHRHHHHHHLPAVRPHTLLLYLSLLSLPILLILLATSTTLNYHHYHSNARHLSILRLRMTAAAAARDASQSRSRDSGAQLDIANSSAARVTKDEAPPRARGTKKSLVNRPTNGTEVENGTGRPGANIQPAHDRLSEKASPTSLRNQSRSSSTVVEKAKSVAKDPDPESSHPHNTKKKHDKEPPPKPPPSPPQQQPNPKHKPNNSDKQHERKQKTNSGSKQPDPNKLQLNKATSKNKTTDTSLKPQTNSSKASDLSYWSDVPPSFPGWVRYSLHWSGETHILKGQPHWQALDKRTLAFVYSAHLDSVSSPPLIRVIGLLHKMVKVMNVTCRYYDNGGPAPSVHHVVSGTLYHFRSLNGRKYVGSYVDCPLVAGSNYLPYAVSVSRKAEEEANNFMVVHYSQSDSWLRRFNYSFYVKTRKPRLDKGEKTTPQHHEEKELERWEGKTADSDWRWNITRCFPAIQKQFNDHVMLTEMVAASLAVGVQRFVFYVQSAGADVLRMLKVLENKGLAEVHPWNMHLSGSNLFYTAQSSSIAECLYRHQRSSRYLLFGDMDELFVPRKQRSLLPLLEEVFSDQSKCGAAIFRNVFFNLNYTSRAPPQEADPSGYALRHRMKMLTHTRRIRYIWPTTRRSKPAVDTRRILTPGIHNVETLREGYKMCTVNPGKGLLHHYRIITRKQAGPMPEMNDEYLWKFTADTIRYFQELSQEFDAIDAKGQP
ncbi:uncharacterized protein LOC143275372 [Babylonia areolata]|uniref:uncharacterized protein LOC143275372 n=1 Tax=Babylonia areolata TaxID=304850 RepID=UPI003FCFD4EA